jgi:hypothetical protein
MAFFRFAGLLALSLWIGGLATLGALTAPVLFDVLGAHDPTSGRELAGVVFGSLFDHFQRASWIAGAVLLLSLGGRAARQRINQIFHAVLCRDRTEDRSKHRGHDDSMAERP